MAKNKAKQIRLRTCKHDRGQTKQYTFKFRSAIKNRSFLTWAWGNQCGIDTERQEERDMERTRKGWRERRVNWWKEIKFNPIATCTFLMNVRAVVATNPKVFAKLRGKCTALAWNPIKTENYVYLVFSSLSMNVCMLPP